VITELWVDYLTQMEALRVSIGLEAYGQRDPLVEYKREAFEKFQNLFKDMRAGVISRMFTYRPRDMSAMQSEAKRPSPTEELDADIAPELQGGDGADAMEEQPDEGMEPEEQAEEADVSVQSNQSKLSRSQKRRRHRK
jgi:preprotein translocase subunit SecA